MGRDTRAVGMAGEAAACALLQTSGHRIIGRNIRTPLGEIDIISEERGVLVFTEVKTRTTASLGPPFLSVTPMKKIRLVRNALSYLKAAHWRYRRWRIDVASVRLTADLALEHIEVITNAVEDID